MYKPIRNHLMGFETDKHNNFSAKEVRLYTHFWLYKPSFGGDGLGL
jgi:hypothetical protein